MDVQIAYGDALKALGDGKVGGIGIRFEGRDLDGEAFKADTYYGQREGDGADCLFHHSVPVKGISRELSDHLFPSVKVTRQELGLFVETVLDMANEYERMVYSLVDQGKLGWSSGAAGHMVRKSQDGTITRWPIVEFSFTPTPAEPRNRVVPIKTLWDESESEDIPKSLKDLISLDDIGNERDYELYLGARGIGRNERTALVSIAKHGFKGIRQREAEDTANAAKLIEQINADRALLDLSSLLTGV